MRDGATGTCVGRCCVAALTFAIYSMEISLKGLFWLASCPEFRFWTEQHIVEKNKPGPSGSCDVDGQCNSSGKPNCCLLSTVALVMRVSGGCVCLCVCECVCTWTTQSPNPGASSSWVHGGAHSVNSSAHSNHSQGLWAGHLCQSYTVVSEMAIRVSCPPKQTYKEYGASLDGWRGDSVGFCWFRREVHVSSQSRFINKLWV